MPQFVASVGSAGFRVRGRGSQFQLAAAKGRMDTVFTENRVCADDPNYVWDKRADFGPADDDSGWDD